MPEEIRKVSDAPTGREALRAMALLQVRTNPGVWAAARAVDGPALIEFCIAEQQNVFPMMPAGKGLSDLLEEQFEEPKQ